MKKTIALKIDVSKIDKSRLFKGEKGTYLDAVLFYDSEQDRYENNGMIVQSVSKEERQAGTRGAILGNAKEMGQPDNQPDNRTTPDPLGDTQDDLPF